MFLPKIGRKSNRATLSFWGETPGAGQVTGTLSRVLPLSSLTRTAQTVLARKGSRQSSLGWNTNPTEGGSCHMKDLLIKLSVILAILKEENGQDLIEYALIVALIAFAAVVGMQAVATDINLAFTNIGTTLASYT